MIRPRPLTTRRLLIRVGLCVRAHRRARHMTQRELAQKARVNSKHLSELECGGENCTLVTLARISEVLGCSLAELMPDEPVSGHVLVSDEDMQRIREAVKVILDSTAPR